MKETPRVHYIVIKTTAIIVKSGAKILKMLQLAEYQIGRLLLNVLLCSFGPHFISVFSIIISIIVINKI